MANEAMLRKFEAPPRKFHIEAPFIISSHSIYRNDILWPIMRKKTELYFYLRTWIIRGKLYNDKLNLYQKYHKNGKLAAAVSIRKLSKNLHISYRKVTCYLKAMNYYGVITIKTIKAKDAYDKQDHNVYIFGEHNQKKGVLNEEIYYIDIIL